MTRIEFSEAARDDRRAITAHTVGQFGIRQARRVRTNFERVLSILAATPAIGHLRDELDPPGHTFRYFVVMKRFIVVYEPTESGIRVARILHGTRNLAAELDRDTGDDRRGR